jgi:hypothetical protein
MGDADGDDGDDERTTTMARAAVAIMPATKADTRSRVTVMAGKLYQEKKKKKKKKKRAGEMSGEGQQMIVADR